MTTWPSGSPPSGRRRPVDRSCSTATRWAGSSSPGTCLTDRTAEAGPRRPDRRPRSTRRWPRWKQSLAPVLASVAPTLAVPNGIDGSTLSRDPSVGAKRVGDPTRVNERARPGSAPRRSREQARVRPRRPAALGVPTLVLHGARRRPRARRRLGGPRGRSRTSSAGPTRASATSSTTSPRARQIIDEIIAWLREQVAAPLVPLHGLIEYRLRGAHRALRVWQRHRPAEPDPARTGEGSRPDRSSTLDRTR